MPKAVAVLFFLLFTSLSYAESAFDIVQKSDQAMRGKSSYSEATMEIVRPDWTRSMTMKSWTKGTELSLVLVTAPAKDKGSASLKRHREMWNWVPSIERIIKIAPSMLSQSWMGSDFTNDDLINQSSIVVDYQHALVGNDSFEGIKSGSLKRQLNLMRLLFGTKLRCGFLSRRICNAKWNFMMNSMNE